MAMSDRPPVLLVPGIGGTILHSVDLRNNVSESAWVRVIDMSDEFKENLWSKYNEETGTTDPLNPRIRIEVPQKTFGLYAIDNLCPSVPALLVYYGTMMKELRTWGYKNGETLFGFGYDFRQSNRHPATMQNLGEKLASIHAQTGRKVNIITHSMGGLVVKSFLALHKEEFAAHVDSWTAIAAPFRGSPALITDTLLCGPHFIPKWAEMILMRKWIVHQMLEQCPSVFEMMAQYDNFKWKEMPTVRVFYKAGEKSSPEATNVHVIDNTEDLLDFLKGVLKDNKVEIDGKTIPLPVNDKCVSWALDTKRIWDTATLPEGVKFYNLYGVGKDTPLHVTYGSVKDPVNPTKTEDLLDENGDFWHVDGDDTVPLESAVADGLDAVERKAFVTTHMDIVKEEKVFDYVTETVLQLKTAKVSASVALPAVKVLSVCRKRSVPGLRTSFVPRRHNSSLSRQIAFPGRKLAGSFGCFSPI